MTKNRFPKNPATSNSRSHKSAVCRSSLISAVLSLALTPWIITNAAAASSDQLIPHGEKAQATGQGINEAWYGCATDRYRHGVLGDIIEGGCLIVIDEHNETHRLTLPDIHVFEDVTPRIADIDGNGSNDVVTVRSHVDSGAGIAVYSLGTDGLVELASTPTIGLRNRWLAPAGIADFNNDGALDIAWVQTPHIGGILRIWSIINDEFVELDRLSGFSNHSIGSTRVSTSRIIDANNDGVPDLALPDQSGTETLIVTFIPDMKILQRLPYEASYFK